jgi:AraC-like DNA-binding protein
MYIFCMRIVFASIAASVLFILTAYGKGGEQPAAPAKPVARHAAPTVLFSVPKPNKVDSLPAALSVKRTPHAADTQVSPLKADSFSAGRKAAADTSKPLMWAGARDSQKTVRAQAAAAVPRKSADTLKMAAPAAPAPINPAVKQPTSKKRSPKTAGTREIFDTRYIVLLMSIIIIGFFLRHILKKSNQPTFVTTTRLSIMDKEVQTACRFIEKNYKNRELSVDSLCEALVTGKAFLGALFHQELGLSVEDFITNVRINRARMLIEKDTSIGPDTAALETGFPDTASFSDAFESIVGVPFEQYRDSRAKNVA